MGDIEERGRREISVATKTTEFIYQHAISLSTSVGKILSTIIHYGVVDKPRNQSFVLAQKHDKCQEVVLNSHIITRDLQSGMAASTELLKGLSLEQRQFFQSLAEENRRLAHNLHQLQGTIQAYTNLPPQVLLQKPVTLLDACGKIYPFHLEYINCAEAFLAVLKLRFEREGISAAGLRMLDDLAFVLQDHKGVIELSRPWEKVFRPNQKVDMSMLFRLGTSTNACPACGFRNDKKPDQEVDW